MSDSHNGDRTRVARTIKAAPETIWAAFVDPAALVQWLPPGTMTGKIHAFDPRVGGGYRMSLFYPPDEAGARGKTAAHEDRVDVRFLALDPPRRIVWAVSFVRDNPGFQGEMTITVTLAAVAGGTDVVFHCENLPCGVRSEDNETGTRLSLEQLARLVE
jgi:uncharacterized protein YndB with AHSA1/START domain